MLMDFFIDSLWWMTFAAALSSTTMAALARSVKSALFIIACCAWIAALASSGFLVGIVAAVAAGTLSLLWGALVFLLTVLLSGVTLLAKKRYG